MRREKVSCLGNRRLKFEFVLEQEAKDWPANICVVLYRETVLSICLNLLLPCGTAEILNYI